jgi:hypothetical protein
MDASNSGDRAKNEAFFRSRLAAMKGPKFVAYDVNRLSGFVHWVQSSECQFSPSEKARLLPGMIAGGRRRCRVAPDPVAIGLVLA